MRAIVGKTQPQAGNHFVPFSRNAKPEEPSQRSPHFGGRRFSFVCESDCRFHGAPDFPWILTS
jgi:hypothetical protein